MLSSLVAWLRRRIDPPKASPPAVDPLALEVSREQRNLAKRLSRLTGRTPEELLDYRRADRILGGRR